MLPFFPYQEWGVYECLSEKYNIMFFTQDSRLVTNRGWQMFSEMMSHPVHGAFDL